MLIKASKQPTVAVVWGASVCMIRWSNPSTAGHLLGETRTSVSPTAEAVVCALDRFRCLIHLPAVVIGQASAENEEKERLWNNARVQLRNQSRTRSFDPPAST